MSCCASCMGVEIAELPAGNRRLRSAVWLRILVMAVLFIPSVSGQENRLLCFQPNALTGSSAAVSVPDVALIHTAQFFPLNPDGQLISADPAVQFEAVLNQLEETLTNAGSSRSRIVKLNCCVAESRLVEVVTTVLARRFSGEHKPAVSMVVTAMPHHQVVVAVDAVAIRDHAEKLNSVRQISHAAIMPGGSRIYVSGQAEQSDSLAEATRRTLESLSSTLSFLERTDDDIVQLKAFVMPMTDAEIVLRELEAFFKGRKVPPTVLVEWKSSTTTPIEIELIAWGGGARSAAPVLEYLTPPGMTVSPIYSRLCRVNGHGSIFVSGLYAASAGDPSAIDSPTAGEREVKEVFDLLKQILQGTGSDFQHLVKATYYVSSNSASQKLNELRPQYYNRDRPPAASKAVVASTGRADLGLTIDMIAVPVRAAAPPR